MDRIPNSKPEFAKVHMRHNKRKKSNTKQNISSSEKSQKTIPNNQKENIETKDKELINRNISIEATEKEKPPRSLKTEAKTLPSSVFDPNKNQSTGLKEMDVFFFPKTTKDRNNSATTLKAWLDRSDRETIKQTAITLFSTKYSSNTNKTDLVRKAINSTQDCKQENKLTLINKTINAFFGIPDLSLPLNELENILNEILIEFEADDIKKDIQKLEHIFEKWQAVVCYTKENIQTSPNRRDIYKLVNNTWTVKTQECAEKVSSQKPLADSPECALQPSASVENQPENEVLPAVFEHLPEKDPCFTGSFKNDFERSMEFEVQESNGNIVFHVATSGNQCKYYSSDDKNYKLIDKHYDEQKWTADFSRIYVAAKKELLEISANSEKLCYTLSECVTQNGAAPLIKALTESLKDPELEESPQFTISCSRKDFKLKTVLKKKETGEVDVSISLSMNRFSLFPTRTLVDNPYNVKGDLTVESSMTLSPSEPSKRDLSTIKISLGDQVQCSPPHESD